MKTASLKLATALLLLLGFLTNAAAQQAVGAEAKASILALKDGVLVVRLPSNYRKIEALQKMVEAASKEKDRERYAQMLEDTKASTRQNNLWLVGAFQKHYRFSKFLFMPDTASQQLKAGKRNGFFLNAELLPDPSIELADSTFFVAWYGTPSADEKTDTEGLTIADAAFNDLAYPFPFFTGRTTMRKLLENALTKTKEKESFEKLVAKLDRRLNLFYLEMTRT